MYGFSPVKIFDAIPKANVELFLVNGNGGDSKMG
jgi:hypothetical protein